MSSLAQPPGLIVVTMRYRIFAVGTYRGVQSIYLPPSYAPTSIPELTRPRSLGDWFGRVR
jgi:hypothetical protein